MNYSKLDRDEKSLLLYFETRLVDHKGQVDLKHMNTDDIRIAKEWNSMGLIGFGRIKAKKIKQYGTHWVTFTGIAWSLAHAERKSRSERMLGRIGYERSMYFGAEK